MSYKITGTGRSQETNSVLSFTILSPLYSVQLYLVWSQNYIKMHSIRGVLQMQKRGRKISHIHKYTATFIPFLSYVHYLSSSPSRFPLSLSLSFTQFVFLILLFSLFRLERIRLNTPLGADGA